MPLGARILAVAILSDAMVSDRPYAKAGRSAKRAFWSSNGAPARSSTPVVEASNG